MQLTCLFSPNYAKYKTFAFILIVPMVLLIAMLATQVEGTRPVFAAPNAPQENRHDPSWECQRLCHKVNMSITHRQSTFPNKLQTTAPTARFRPAMAYDSKNGQMVLFGGENSLGKLPETWIFDGLDWSQVVTTTSPGSPAGTGLIAARMSYDKARGRAMLRTKDRRS